MVKKISDKEKQLIVFIREIGWGDVKIRIENGQPVVVYEAIKTFKLGDSLAKANRTAETKTVRC
ncbi:hypothetical protein [Desulfolucanica intricata]|uniref:hypothetical protein n=1 Tax=Desulfolucanica intricata TaxID=1285191 RepID=UPI00082EBF31|nr:hypothetical protein [Desulfolucanica intricata]